MNLKDTVTRFYVSPEGNDNWTGTLEKADGGKGPFKTIQKARDVVRELIKDGMDSDINVYLRGGSYYLEDTLRFDERDSGRDGFKIIYRNDQDEEPILNGGCSITGWEIYQGSIYRAKVDAGWRFYTLYENGVRSKMARHPNQGYNGVDEMVKEAPKVKFKYKEGDVPDIGNLESLQVYMWAGGLHGEWNWFSDTVSVSAVDAEDRVITLNSPTHYDMGAGSRYFIQGALELLDQPGEFFLDSQEGYLYYWPMNVPIEEQDIVASKVIRAIEFRGSAEAQPVENIQLQGITLRNSDIPEEFKGGTPEDGILYMENARNIVIKYCKIHSTGLHGIFINGWAQNNSIYGNLIYDIGHTGIQINGFGATLRYVNKNNRIENNYLYNLGSLVGHGAGIQLMNSGDNQVTHNCIHDASRYAISLKGARPGVIEGKIIDGVLATRENAHEFTHSRNNYIAFNDLYNVNTDSQDTGLFEAWGPGRGNRIHNNRMHDSNIYFSFGFGLYLDDASNDFTVTNNIIYGLQREGAGRLMYAVFSKGIGNKFYNNIIANNFAQAGFGSQEMAGEPNRDLVIERNIFYNTGDQVYGFINWDEGRFAQADYNLFYNEQGKYEIGRVEAAKNFSEWKKLLNGKYDQHSITADPLFMDPAKGDYRLRERSPAYGLGFEDIDFDRIGLKEDFPSKYI